MIIIDKVSGFFMITSSGVKNYKFDKTEDKRTVLSIKLVCFFFNFF